MMIERGLGEVAQWSLMWRAQADASDRAAAIIEVARVCERVAAVLRAERLLRPDRIELDEWRERATGAVVDRPAASRALPPDAEGQDLVQSVLELMAEADPSGQLYATAFEATGSGTILLPGGSEQERPDVLWLRAAVSGGYSVVWLASQTDAWLPYTLLAVPQPEVRALNAPRLERTMRAIERAVGMEWEFESHTRLAGMTRYGATNLGEPPLESEDDVYVPDRAYSATP